MDPANDPEAAEALFEFARRGKAAQVQELLQRGVPADAYKTYDGCSPCAMAARKGHQEGLRTDEGTTVLMHAVSGASAHAVRVLLEAKATPNDTNEDGITPLMFAAETGSIDVARLLVTSGADVNAKAEGWGSALDAALEAGHQELADYLVSVGAKATDDDEAQGERKVSAGEFWGYDAFDGEEDY
eukprot:TRINITY_DN73456_c0_g1_i2.p1 TRINITY_DN73456_c0_g1~~TRINITY_DN73456_c0_g1_i2.p1  ORF type:complete len:186 (-),score=62.82 TRINITY_DN73456_c0_g1_i2:83-640(-)